MQERLAWSWRGRGRGYNRATRTVVGHRLSTEWFADHAEHEEREGLTLFRPSFQF